MFERDGRARTVSAHINVTCTDVVFVCIDVDCECSSKENHH